MQDKLARYLDGELSEEEAALLMRMVAEDPALEKEIREYETILSAAERLPRRRPSAGFEERVMEALEEPHVRRSGKRAPSSLKSWYAAAAALILGVFLGFIGSNGLAPEMAQGDAGSSEYPAYLPIRLTSADHGAAQHTAVRLTYSGSRPDLDSVSVAGSFNGWNPTATPMTLENGAWTILLVLPPGSHEYMFVENGTEWVTDPRAPGTRQDGFGGVNGLLAIRS
jgi:hypothetical protein